MLSWRWEVLRSQFPTCLNLGVMLDKHAKMDTQISSICRSTHFHLRNTFHTIYVDKNCNNTACPFTITCGLDYCNSLLYGLPHSQLDRLQRIQNIACRVVCWIPKAECVIPYMREQHWVPVKQRILFKVLLLTYRAYNSIALRYLCDLVSPKEPTRWSLRRDDKLKLSKNVIRLKSYGGRCFEFSGAEQWNKLDIRVRKVKSLSSFKRSLKTTLFEQAYGIDKQWTHR